MKKYQNLEKEYMTLQLITEQFQRTRHCKYGVIFNKEIEKIQEVSFNPDNLTFQPWDHEQIIAKIDSTEIETHLGDVYQALAASNSTINEKLNALFYFESIIIGEKHDL